MRKTAIGISIIFILVLGACKHNSSGGSLNLQVNPMFGGNSFKIDSTYESPDGKYYYIFHFQMDLSHIKLIRTDGTTVEVNPVAFFNLNDTSGSVPLIPLTNTTGSFKGIQFNIGLDSIQENTAENGNVNSPFYGAYYWSTTLQYVFAELDGNADTNKIPVQAIGYHIGTQTYYTTVVLNKNFTLSGSGSYTLNMNMDLQRIFYGGSNPINVLNSNEQFTSTTPVPALCQQFITNLDSVFTLQ